MAPPSLLHLDQLILSIGPTGLVALKNLREEGFEVTAFEKGPTIGGLWKFNPDPNITSALPSKFDMIGIHDGPC